MAGKYTYEFHCRTCAKMEQIGDSWYCIPLRSGTDPLYIDGYHIRCREYEDTQMSMFDDKEVADDE